MFEVQQLIDGEWKNLWTIDDDTPLVFGSEQDAADELAMHKADWPQEGYPDFIDDEFRVVRVAS